MMKFLGLRQLDGGRMDEVDDRISANNPAGGLWVFGSCASATESCWRAQTYLFFIRSLSCSSKPIPAPSHPQANYSPIMHRIYSPKSAPFDLNKKK
jgi:hypothetical protein